MKPETLGTMILALTLVACSDDGDAGDSNGGNDGGAVGKAGPPPPPIPDDCIQDVTPGHQTISCEGLEFELNVPESCLEQHCGLIFDVHGFGMIGPLQDQHTRLRELGGNAGYIVVNPTAPGMVLQTSWQESHDEQVHAFMQRVIAAWHVDRKRIHFTGYSQGGYMTWRFACKHADLIASVAPLAAGTGTGGGRSCPFEANEQPSRKLPVFFCHGTTDGLVPYATAEAQRDLVVAAWGLTEPEVVSSGSDHEWTRWEGDGALFEFAHHDWETSFMLGSIPLRGHCFPGSGEFLGCGDQTAFDWGESVLKFFQDHPMP